MIEIPRFRVQLDTYGGHYYYIYFDDIVPENLQNELVEKANDRFTGLFVQPSTLQEMQYYVQEKLFEMVRMGYLQLMPNKSWAYTSPNDIFWQDLTNLIKEESYV